MANTMRRGEFCWLGILLLVLRAAVANGTTIDKNPRPAILLKSGGFVAQDSPASVTAYDAAGKILVRFKSTTISQIAVSADETHLAIVADDGYLAIVDLTTAAVIWSKTSAQSHLTIPRDVSFSHDGNSFAVCDDQPQIVVFNTLTGQQISLIRSSLFDGASSVALSPNGSTGVMSESGDRLFTFDVTTGAVKALAIKGGSPIRYSSDGRYIALPSSNSGLNEQLRIVDVATMQKSDVGYFRYISHMRPTTDGRFQITSEQIGDKTDAQVTIGSVCDPGTQMIERIWEATEGSVAECLTDFDPVRKTGVSTSYCYVTSVIDLNINRVQLIVDNSANYTPSIISTSSRASGWKDLISRAPLLVGFTAALGFLVLVVIWAISKRGI